MYLFCDIFNGLRRRCSIDWCCWPWSRLLGHHIIDDVDNIINNNNNKSPL